MNQPKNDKPKSQLELTTPVQFIKGVGPARAETFARLGVETVGDLLEYYPRDHVFVPTVSKIDQITEGQTVTITGMIESTDYREYSRPPIFEAYLADETAACRLIWFHGRYLHKQLHPGQTITASGKVSSYKHQIQITNPTFAIADEKTPDEAANLGGAVYPATTNLSSTQIRRTIANILDAIPELVDEFFTDAFRKKTELIKRSDALAQIHNPTDDSQLPQAKRRLKYDELFLMQLGLALRRYRARHLEQATPMARTDEIDSRIRKRFPFLLTADQDSVIDEIATDMSKKIPMNRLLQGDVGSGKTVVALYAALLAIANKTQVAIMAPTEVLANQHFVSIERYLRNSNVKRELLTGGLTGKKRTAFLKRIKTGQIDIVVGTVALLQKDIEFENLGLVIIDEQHKFGVDQRSQLRKQSAPHNLVMTATPIPRTLAMTVFGDLDVSIINHSPPGRGSVVTKLVEPHNRSKAYEFIRGKLKAGQHAYFVYPRIFNDDDKDNIKAATAEYETISKKIFPEFNVALLHGQMPSATKQETMNKFRSGKIDVLVSTVVIEVGVDVTNATIMVIETADHFGLAQLHQLRGRIGRGEKNSYCLLFSETENEEAKSRLDIMSKTTDGFKIAEHDLQMRGPGEMFSTRQHGLPDLKIANIIEDYDLLVMARNNAFELTKKDPALTKKENQNIRAALLKKFGKTLGLVDIA